MKTQEIITKVKAYPLALSLFGVSLLLAGWTFWRSTGALVDAHTESDTVNQQSQVVGLNNDASKLLDDQLAELNADATKLADGLINPADDINNQQYFWNIEREAGVDQVTNPARINTVVSKDPAEPTIATFTLSVAGQWKNLVSFVYDLKTGPHPLRVSLMGITKSPQIRGSTGDNDRLNLTLTVDLLGK